MWVSVKMREREEGMREADPSDHLDVGRPRAVIRGNSVDDSNYVALYKPYIVDVAVFLRHLQEVLDKVHDVGAGVHVILRYVS